MALISCEAQAELLADRLLNGLDGDLAALLVDDVLEHLLGGRQVDRGAGERPVGDQADERAFQLAHVAANVAGDELGDIVGQGDMLALGLLLQNGDLGFKIGRLDVGNQAPLEAGAETVLDLGQFLGRTVAGDDDLTVGVMQRIEGVEELLLGALLAGEELDVVDQQQIDAAETVAEAHHLVVLDGVDHLVGELFGGEIDDGAVGLAQLDLMADGLHEVGFAHAHAAVEEQRVVRLAGSGGYGQGRGVGELVSAADDEAVEGVTGIELGGAVEVKARLGRGTRGRRTESAVVANDGGGGGWLGLRRRGDQLDIVVGEAEFVDGFQDQIVVALPDGAELGRGYGDEELSIGVVAEAGGLEPGVVGVAVDLFFQGTQDLHPRIRS